MNNMPPLLLVVQGLVLAILEAWGLLSDARTGGASGPVPEPTSTSRPAAKAKLPLSLRIARLGGISWFCLGIGRLWSSGIRDPVVLAQSWIKACVGLGWIIIGAWVVLATVRLPVKRQRLSAATASGKEKARLVEIVTQHAEQALLEGHVGLVVGAIASGEEILLGFGARGTRDSQPPGADTVFEIGSITKTFTAILLAQQIENGELELDDRIAGLLPEGWSLSEQAREVTLRHCTTHTSGFPGLPANLLGFSEVFHLMLGGDPYRNYTEEQFRTALATVELKSAPGTKSVYSNFAVGLLGFALATKNGSDFETLVTSKICQPLGMHRTAITSDAWQTEHMVAGYRMFVGQRPARLGLKSDEWRLPNHLAGAGALRSTGRDMLTFLKANMSLIPTPIDAAIERSHQELFRESPDRAIGMNWIRSLDSTISQNIIWHNGGTGGFRSFLGFTEDRQCGVLILANLALSVDALALEILKALQPLRGRS